MHVIIVGMQTNIAKRNNIFFKVLLGVLFLFIVGAAQSTTIKKSLVYDDSTTELVSDIDIDGEIDDDLTGSLALVPSSYNLLHETSEQNKPTAFCTQQTLVERSGKLYILFHQLKLHIA